MTAPADPLEPAERIPKCWQLDTERLLLGRALNGHPLDRRLRSWHFAEPGHQRLFCSLLLAGGWTGIESLKPVADALRQAKLWYGLASVALFEELMGGAAYTREPSGAEIGEFVRSANRRLAAQKLAWLAAGVRRGEISHAQLRAELDVIS